MRALLPCLALLAAGASSAAAQTQLEDVLYVATQFAAQESANSRTAVTQDADSLRAEVFVRRNGGSLESLLRAVVTRIDGCKFEVSLTTRYKYSLHSVDLRAADLASAHPVIALHGRNYLNPGIVIPGAKFCHVGGRPSFNHIGAGACVETFAPGPASLPPNDAKVLAAIHRLEKSCTARVSMRSGPQGHPYP